MEGVFALVSAFESARGRFGTKRKDGASKLRGNAGAAAGLLWSLD
jgi:hypothetical protein